MPHQRYAERFPRVDEVEVQKLDLKAGKTEPPDYLTESELITLMEKVPRSQTRS